MRRRLRLLRVRSIALVVVTLAATACSTVPGDYDRAPFPDGHHPSSSFRSAAQQFAADLASGRTHDILAEETATDSRPQMRRFVQGFGNRPTTVLALSPANDNMGEERIGVRCPDGRLHERNLTWGWLSGRWRAWPAGTWGMARAVTAACRG